MSRGPRLVSSEDDESWEKHRLLVRETQERHNRWLLELAKEVADIRVENAVRRATDRIYAGLIGTAGGAIISVVVGLLIHWLAK